LDSILINFWIDVPDLQYYGWKCWFW
jgi:hypothetical protein